MKHRLHYILDILLFSFLTSLAAWGQVETVMIDLAQYPSGYTITDGSKTYIITGMYSGTPNQSAGVYKAVIKSDDNITAKIILKDVTIKFDGEKEDHIPFYFSKATKITLLLEGRNVISGGADNAAICVPSSGELIIDSKNEGVLEVSGGRNASAIGSLYLEHSYKGQISIQGGTITAKGIITSKGRGSGIGANFGCDGGTILISGGTVTANGTGGAPGIGPAGGSLTYSIKGGSITITGGNVTATSHEEAPGIGIGLGSRSKREDPSEGISIMITGGKVTATGSGRAPGIGKSGYTKGGSITISGGVVKATGGTDGVGIGAYNYAPDETPPSGDSHIITISGGYVSAVNGVKRMSDPSIAVGQDETFSTGNNGNAFIYSYGIGDQSNKSYWEGVIIEMYEGYVYGTSVTLSSEGKDEIRAIPPKATLTNEKELIIPEGVILENNGTILNKGTLNIKYLLRNYGEIKNDKEITGSIFRNQPKHAVTFNFNYPESPEAEIQYVTENELPADPASSRIYHTFKAWFDKASEGAEVTSITKPTTVYAYWDPNPISIVSAPSTLTGETNHAITDYKLSELITGSDDSGSKTYEWASSTDEHYGLSLSNGIISGVPTKSTPTGATLPVLIKAENGATADVDIPISITLPTFYTITLPANPVGYSLLKPDGSPFSPSDLLVEEGTAFSFKLQLEPDYSESTPTVEADGVSGALTADPDGVYTIPAIQADTEIRVSGVIKNTPPPPPPAPSYYSLSIPATLTGAILHGGGTYTVEEGDCVEFRIELDPNGAGVYPAVYANGWNSLRPLDADGTYRVWVYEDTEIRIGEVPGYVSYELSFPGDTVWQTEDTYYTGAGITVESLRADVPAYPFGSLIRLDAADTPHREFLEWFDGTTVRPYDLTVREGLEVRALFRSKSPVGNTPVEASGLRITTAPGCIDIRVSRPVPVCVYSVTGVLLRQAWVSDTKRFAGLAAGIYLVAAGEERHKVTVR